jgi:predicted RNase H-like HicB family nuclease
MDPVLLARARKIAEQYRIILEPDEDAGYIGHPLELPGCYDDGKTPDECVANVIDAATTLVAYMFEEGRTPPVPATEAKRTEQINVRLTEEEKLRIEAAAKRDGFRGISDFVRAAAIASTVER